MTPFFSFASLAYAREARLHCKEQRKKRKKKKNKEKLQNPNNSKKNESSLGCPENLKKNVKRHLLDLHGHQRYDFFFFLLT